MTETERKALTGDQAALEQLAKGCSLSEWSVDAGGALFIQPSTSALLPGTRLWAVPAISILVTSMGPRLTHYSCAR
jgi:hypothetical protein